MTFSKLSQRSLFEMRGGRPCDGLLVGAVLLSASKMANRFPFTFIGQSANVACRGIGRAGFLGFS